MMKPADQNLLISIQTMSLYQNWNYTNEVDLESEFRIE